MKIRIRFNVWVFWLTASILYGQAATFTWTNTAGGNWSATTNWSPNLVPGAPDDAIIASDVSYAVTLDVNVTVQNLTLGGKAGIQTLACPAGFGLTVYSALVQSNGVLNLAGGSLPVTCTIQPGGALTLSGTGTKSLYSCVLINYGTVTWAGGYLETGGYPGTAITNAGLFDLQSNDTASLQYGNLPHFINFGTLRKSVSTGTSQLSNLDFQNFGLVDIQTGGLLVNGLSTSVSLGGTINVGSGAAFNLANGAYYDAGGVLTGAGVRHITAGTLNLSTNLPVGLALDGGTVVLGPGFQQAGAITNLLFTGAQLAGTYTVSGLLTFQTGSAIGQITVLPGAQLVFSSSSAVTLMACTLINQGTVTWAGGYLNTGGYPGTAITNIGLFDLQSNDTMSLNSGDLPHFINFGTLRKSAGTGTSQLSNLDFQNFGLVDIQTGGLLVNGLSTSVSLGGTINVGGGAAFNLANGAYYDAGGVLTGAGVRHVTAGTLNLRTNVPMGLALDGGTVVLGPDFQQAGAITNLLFTGAQLAGTNTVSGLLTFQTGSAIGQLTVLPGAQLVFNSSSAVTLVACTLVNQGTVTWAGGYLNTGGYPGTVITNIGLFDLQSNDTANLQYGDLPHFINLGTLRKSAGTGTSQFFNLDFQNSGLVECDTGTLRLLDTYTNTAGTLRVNGGRIDSRTLMVFAGGRLEGSGSTGISLFTDGTISPGLSGPGLITCTAGLSLGPGVTLQFDATGTNAGSEYDQIAVMGAVNLAGATLQLTSITGVPVGAHLVLIANDATDPVQGTFNGLLEGASFVGDGKLFHLNYSAGTGNDVAATLDGIPEPALLSIHVLGGGLVQLLGQGSNSAVYTILASTNLADWVSIGTPSADSSGILLFTDTDAPKFPSRFYRSFGPPR